MRIKSFLRLAILLAAGWALVAPALAYVFITDASGIYVVTWPPGAVPIQVRLSQGANLSDGNSQSSSVLAAMQSWNAVLGTVQLAGTAAVGPYALDNGINEIAMDSAVDGENFDSGVLAVTLSSHNGNSRAEADIIFNNSYAWDSYRGSLRASEDIQRVALHELGHVLGLDHPDEHSQYVSAIMNSHEGSTYTLQSDDITGVQKLYGAPGVKPGNDNFANATVISLSGLSSLQVTGSNIAATREADEPNHTGVAQGHSVWWKWTAPGSDGVNINTFGSNYDTVMAVYTGASLNTLTLVAENDDQEPSSSYSGPGRKRTGSVNFNAVAGTTYYIAVDGWGDVSAGTIPYVGLITLTVNFGVVSPPFIHDQPIDKSVYEGDSVTLGVYAPSDLGFSYRWQWLPTDSTKWIPLADTSFFTGTTTRNLQLSNVPSATSGDQFRCVVTNTAGLATISDVATLTIRAKPAPTVSTPAFRTGSNGATIASVTTSGPGSFSYQWYHNGVPVTGATSGEITISAAAGLEFGEYFAAVTNEVGTTLSRTISLAPTTTDSGGMQDYYWTRAVEADGVVYFLFNKPAQIARYDLTSETWLPSWTLAQAAADFAITSDAIYLATGATVTRYDRNLASPATLVTEATNIITLTAADEYLVTTYRTGNDNGIASYNRTTGQKMFSAPQGYGYAREISYGSANRRIYGVALRNASSVGSLRIGTDGTIDTYLGVQDADDLPFPVRTIVLPDGAVADLGGMISNGSDLKFAGSLGGPLNDLAPDGAGGYYVLRRSRVSRVDTHYRETGASTGHLSLAARIWRRNNALFLFAQPTASGVVPMVEKVAVSAVQPAALAAVADPANGRYSSTQWLVDDDGIVYIYSKLDRNIYRWSTQTKGFLASIPLANTPDFMSYSPETKSLYFEENGRQIRRIALDSGSTYPIPAGTSPLALSNLQAVGDLLWLAMPGDRTSAYQRLVLNADNHPLRHNSIGNESTGYSWNSNTRRIYSILNYTSPTLLVEQIDATGASVTSATTSGSVGDVTQPIRVASDGSRVVVGSGQVMDGASLNLLGKLLNPCVDAAWARDGLYTIRQVGDSTELQSWMTDSWLLKADRVFPGTPVRLIALPDGRMLLGTSTGGELDIRIVEPGTFSVLAGPPVSTKTPQSITFAGPAAAVLRAPLELGATASSGLPVRLSVVSGSATITGTTFVATVPGDIVIRASQAGDDTYESAVSVTQVVTVNKPVLNVTTSDRTRIYGATNPIFAVEYSGFLEGDTEAMLTYKASASSPAQQTSVPGTYPINIGFAVSTYYDFIYHPATLTVTKAPLIVKANNIVQQAGTAIPTLTMSYTGFASWENQSVLTSQPTVSTTATIDSPYGVYPITVTGGSSDNYEITRVNGTLRIIPPSYNQTYFGTFASGGHWALQVRADGTATYLAYLPGRSSVIATELTVATDGSFSVTGTEVKKSTATTVSGLALASPEAPVIRTGAAAGDFTLTGQIAANGAVTGSLGGFAETLTGAAEPTTGPAQALAGYYRAVALNTATGATHVIVGASGQAVVVTTTPSAVDGASGIVNSSGQLAVTTSGGATLSASINATAQSVSASLTPAGSSTPITFAGLSNSVVPDARVVNLSVRTPAGTGSQTLIVGFVVTGTGSKSLLLRGIGPGLVSQGVSNALGDPAMRLLDATGTELSANNDWGGSAQMAQFFSSLGATPLPTDSKDAALSSSIAPGVYSCHIYSNVAGSGVILAEFYDADQTASSANVVNLSARTQVGTGGDILIAGFVITGNAPKTLIIRGVGPTLTGLGVTGALANPQIYLYGGPNIIASNDDWGGTTELKTAFDTVGAGPLVSDTSKDAALLVTLQPGVYSAQVSGVGGTTGVGLVEIFLMP